jgi:hypothetical protein
MRTTKPSPRRRAALFAGLAALALPLMVPAVASAQGEEGFDAYIQDGTCAEPGDTVQIALAGAGEHDVEPYLAQEGGEDTALGFYGSSLVPGFGLSAIYTSQRFSLVVTEEDNEVACGDILRPDGDRYREVGVAVTQLLPVGESAVQGVALIERTRMQRELDVTPTRVSIVLATDSPVAEGSLTDGFDGYVQSGTCDSPTEDVRVALRSRDEVAVPPYLAGTGSGDPVAVAYAGSPLVPGFGLAAAYSTEDFSLAITEPGGDEVACGDILRPSARRYLLAGVALVQLEPVENSDVTGFAVIQRTAMERELDVTPTRVRVVLFAPPAQVP